ncbi:MAG: acetyl-CoA C-acetyltransferase, partial [Planctomycetes bacterium]|nr:acetyl-CoA C-acetyltransferase [Planctomycetota bacterium]
AYIVSAARTAIGRFQGSLAPVGAPQLGAIAIKAALERGGVDPDLVEDVIMGCVLQAGLGQNPARQALRAAGIPDRIGAMTINKVCGSGLKAVALAAQAIRAGDLDCLVAGGMENMTRSPYLAPGIRDGLRLGHGQLIDSMVNDGLWDIYNDFHMGMTGELVAEKYGIGREAQDAFAVDSHQRAVAAQDAGHFDAEIAAVEVPGRKGAVTIFDRDEAPRRDTSLEALAKLRPAFKRDGGTVTAGNAPGCNDGGAALLVCSEAFVKNHKLKPLARVTGYQTGGAAPEWVMMAPVDAVQRLLARTGDAIADFDQIELNEAFSVAALAVTRELEADPARVNPDGGAVALGHPIGASGARILVTLLHGLKRRGGKKGLAALCLGGGNAVALSVESC